MNWECICNYVVSNALQVLGSVHQQRTQQQFCDESGCYNTEDEIARIDPQIDVESPSTTTTTVPDMSPRMILVIGLFLLFGLLTMVNRQKKKNYFMDEKLRARRNNQNNGNNDGFGPDNNSYGAY